MITGAVGLEAGGILLMHAFITGSGVGDGPSDVFSGREPRVVRGAPEIVRREPAFVGRDALCGISSVQCGDG